MKLLLSLACAAVVAGCAGTAQMRPSAVATLAPKSGSQVQGIVRFIQRGDRMVVEGEISGLSPGPHGFHVHEQGDCSSPDGMSAGGHFNPAAVKHGAPESEERHAGDLGNIVADSSGKATVNKDIDVITVAAGPYSIIGRGLIVHAGPDDLKTDPTGNAGGRLACGTITRL
jgi:Cu-Zn family superoxide dismutase